MKQAVVIDANEVREILAEKFQVPVERTITISSILITNMVNTNWEIS